MALLRRLSTATAATTVALVVVGGIVRASGSGDACPQWPGCVPGRILPPLEVHAIIEFTHRLVALILSVLVVTTAWVAWRRERRDPAVLWSAVAAVAVLVVQSAIGAIRIETGPRALVTTLHFLTAMVLLSLVVITGTASRMARRRTEQIHVSAGFRPALWWTLGVTALLLLVGAYVRGEGAGLVFLDWPLMDGRFVPALSSDATVATFAHRVLAAIAVVLGAVLAVRSTRIPHVGVRALAWSAFGLLVVQAGLGAAAVLTRLAPWSVAGHVAGSSLAWAALVALAATVVRVAPRRPGRKAEGEPPPGRATRAGERVAAYLQLTKPDIIVLLLITTVPAMVLAEGGMPAGWLIAATLFGGTLAAAGANAVNCYLDRDIDEVMARTRRRPLPSHRVDPRAAVRFGAILVAASFAWLAATVNVLSATLTVAAAGFYVVVYTLWMKRRTPQNIVIGGAAGAVPALVGWSAVTGTVAAPAVVLFGIVFLWTPPHFWALALRHTNEYAAARVPMLPVLRGRRDTAVHILRYTVLLVAVSLILVPVGQMGVIYLASAAVLGATLVGFAVRLHRHPDARSAMALFRFSITYLALLFAAVAADRLVLGR